MPEQHPDARLIAAVRAGCDADGTPGCDWPGCTCDKLNDDAPSIVVRAALAAVDAASANDCDNCHTRACMEEWHAARMKETREALRDIRALCLQYVRDEMEAHVAVMGAARITARFVEEKQS